VFVFGQIVNILTHFVVLYVITGRLINCVIMNLYFLLAIRDGNVSLYALSIYASVFSMRFQFTLRFSRTKLLCTLWYAFYCTYHMCI
jgi:hypothetical protein